VCEERKEESQDEIHGASSHSCKAPLRYVLPPLLNATTIVVTSTLPCHIAGVPHHVASALLHLVLTSNDGANPMQHIAASHYQTPSLSSVLCVRRLTSFSGNRFVSIKMGFLPRLYLLLPGQAFALAPSKHPCPCVFTRHDALPRNSHGGLTSSYPSMRVQGQDNAHTDAAQGFAPAHHAHWGPHPSQHRHQDLALCAPPHSADAAHPQHWSIQ
jgi:hypothetical protein